MQWEIINTEPIVPKCKFCNDTTDQMARFWLDKGPVLIFICYNCARYVKEALNKWPNLKSTDYIEPDSTFDSKFIDTVIEENKEKAGLVDEINIGHGEPDPMGKFTKPIGKDLTLDTD